VVKSNNFDILNEKVLNLISRFNELKEENKELANKVAWHEKERRKTKSKVEKIINKIEELEVGE
jgi:uncharacterized coiled-coil DUF342 family protein